MNPGTRDVVPGLCASEMLDFLKNSFSREPVRPEFPVLVLRSRLFSLSFCSAAVASPRVPGPDSPSSGVIRRGWG